MVFFWACEVTETKAAIVKIPEGFVLNVCNATLASFDAKSSVVSLGVETTQMDKTTWKGVVAHLGAAANAHQYKLDLVFGVAPQLKFYVAKGTGKVHLSGYFQPGPPSDMLEDELIAEGIEVGSPSDDEQAAPAPKKQDAQPKKNNKKRARDEEPSVTWDQAASSDSEEEEKEVKKAEPAKKQPKKEEPKPKAPAQQPKPTAAAPTANGSAESAQKKKKKNRKNKNKGNKDN
ncbi:hypothetical protein PINS_up001103 [Pythium insidiosum]|nr:hypothetical protein PINS_up001103 [Pythium insidiosum]